jgi:hypothetical protein
MFENRLCTVSTRKVKLTFKSAIIYEPASSSLLEKMLIDISRRQPVKIIRTRIAKQSGKDDDNQQQIELLYILYCSLVKRAARVYDKIKRTMRDILYDTCDEMIVHE